jgi:two-component system OmpR family sensor kinase
MSRRDSVRSQVLKLLLGIVLLLSVLAGAAVVGVTSLKGDVDTLVDDLRPAIYSNIALRNDLARAQTGARGWSLTGERQFLDRYRLALLDAEAEMRTLSEHLGSDEELTALAAQQTAAVEKWTRLAGAQVRRPPGPVPPELLLESQDAFDRVVALNDGLSFRLNDGIDARGARASVDARRVIMLVGVLSLLGLAVTVLLGRAVVRTVSGPMRDMEAAVARLSSGDLTTRVSTDGPREMRGVAVALNTLAEENQRSREMEGRVVAQLRELDRAKDEFVSTVSHELRTPLTSIAGYLELMEDSFDGLTPQQAGMVEVVGRNVGRLRNLIEDLLTLSRVESDAFRTTFEHVDMDRLIADVARDVAQIASRADVRVRVSGLGRPVVVHGDAGQLSRALLNLVTNAIKFSPAGSPVLIRLSEFDGRAVVSVVDHGIGIPGPELQTLGTRFFRASNAVQSEITGTGLGLRIVQTVADNHGGRLDLESVEGAGTTARLVVPVAAEPAPARDAVKQPGRRSEPVPTEGNNPDEAGIRKG